MQFYPRVLQARWLAENGKIDDGSLDGGRRQKVKPWHVRFIWCRTYSAHAATAIIDHLSFLHGPLGTLRALHSLGRPLREGQGSASEFEIQGADDVPTAGRR